MDDLPKESRSGPTTTVWTRRSTLAALVVLLTLSALRLVNSLFRNTDSVIFPFVPRFPWDALVYSAFELGLVLMVLIVADRELRARRSPRKLVSPPKEGPQAVKAPAPIPPRPDKAKKPAPVYYTITGEVLNPTEQDSEDKKG